MFSLGNWRRALSHTSSTRLCQLSFLLTSQNKAIVWHCRRPWLWGQLLVARALPSPHSRRGSSSQLSCLTGCVNHFTLDQMASLWSHPQLPGAKGGPFQSPQDCHTMSNVTAGTILDHLILHERGSVAICLLLGSPLQSTSMSPSQLSATPPSFGEMQTSIKPYLHMSVLTYIEVWILELNQTCVLTVSLFLSKKVPLLLYRVPAPALPSFPQAKSFRGFSLDGHFPHGYPNY